ncbi:hypothetical protein ACHAXR_006352, partial [Thalassiosira sp. AJA248-18]
APTARADGVQSTPNESKPRKRNILSDILNKVQSKVGLTAPGVVVDDDLKVPAEEAAASQEDEAVEEPPPQPVCKSGYSGAISCTDPSEESKTSASADITTIPPVQDPEEDNDAPKQNIFQCKDLDEKCPSWSKMKVGPGGGVYDNACDVNSAYMSQYCPISCNTCELNYLGYRLSAMLEGGLAIIPFCQDNDFNCRQYAKVGECDKNPEYMSMFCEASCGICSEESNHFGVGQKMHSRDPHKKEMIIDRLDNSIKYMDSVRRDRLYKNVRKDCLNKVPDCTLWAANGECENNENYMKVMCAPACMSCDYLGDTSETCHGLPESAGPLWKPGDLNAFFETIADNVGGNGEEYRKYNPVALSRPKQKSNGLSAPGVKKDGPWVLLLENFLTDEEADRMVQIGTIQGYERSSRTVGAGQPDVTDGRTSYNTWCQEPSCMEDPLVSQVLKRIAATTKSTTKHGEHLQLLRYEPGQSYTQHHDFIPYQLDYPCGARVMTLFLYLNDVAEGGNTSFPEIGVSVKPKKGSAVLWPNVKDDDPTEKDPRTDHEAEVVVKGVKYGANSWIHSEDFQTPFALKCLQ